MNTHNENENVSKKADWNVRPYLAVGLTVFLVFCACMLVGFVLLKFTVVQDVFSKITKALAPVIIGLILAYIMNPIAKKFEKLFTNTKIAKKVENPESYKKAMRIVSSVLTILLLLIFLAGVIMLLIPSLIDNTENFVREFPQRARSLINWVADTIDVNKDTPFYILLEENGIDLQQKALDSVKTITKWFNDDLLPNIDEYIKQAFAGVSTFVIGFKNFIIGLIVGAIVLIEKDHIEAVAKKTIYVLWKPKTANGIVEVIHKSHKIFGEFIAGKIVDSIIIGILCFIICMIFKIPYAGMVSAIIGITNVVPFFGPIIGAIPTILIILLANPLKALTFLIIVIVLQTFDGYILGPKILGDSTGLSSFWVIFAIMLGGGLFGVPGMLISVPTFAVIYFLIERAYAKRLEKRGLPVETMLYTTVTSVDEETLDLKRDGWDRNEEKNYVKTARGVGANIKNFFKSKKKKKDK